MFLTGLFLIFLACLAYCRAKEEVNVGEDDREGKREHTESVE
jgi:hypothetical protein